MEFVDLELPDNVEAFAVNCEAAVDAFEQQKRKHTVILRRWQMATFAFACSTALLAMTMISMMF